MLIPSVLCHTLFFEAQPLKEAVISRCSNNHFLYHFPTLFVELDLLNWYVVCLGKFTNEPDENA